LQWGSAIIYGARRFSHDKVKAQQSVHGGRLPAASDTV
jgi:hypothetical protein